MDKFGIFKLITSLFDFYKQNKTENDSDSDINSKESSFETPKKQNEQTIPNSKKETSPNDSRKLPNYAAVPLKSQMIKTITSHDELVKRVNAKNNSNALTKN